MAKTTKPRLTAAEIEAMFGTEDACKELLTTLRWPEAVACPRCGETKRVYRLRTRPFHWVCKNPSEACPGVYRFSVLTGTIFENTNMPLVTWFRVAFLMLSSKKGVSALQVHRMMPPVRGKKGSYKTAWYMCHRIRAAMADGGLLGQLAGTVEVDETYVGGDPKNRHGGKLPGWKRPKRAQKPNVMGTRTAKVPVIGAIARKGNVVCRVLDKVTAATMHGFVQEVVSEKVSLVATDDHLGYRGLKHLGYTHESVRHTQGEYVRGQVHTQNLDSFWSLLKRGIVGTYHKVSRAHLGLYLNEFAWRHNHRHDEDIFFSLLAGC
jgi:transposase-like protein